MVDPERKALSQSMYNCLDDIMLCRRNNNTVSYVRRTINIFYDRVEIGSLGTWIFYCTVFHTVQHCTSTKHRIQCQSVSINGHVTALGRIP